LFLGCWWRRCARSPRTGERGDGLTSPVEIRKEPPEQHRFGRDGNLTHGEKLDVNRRAVTFAKPVGSRE